MREFLSSEASGGLILIAAAAAAMLVANSALANAYRHLLSTSLGPLSVVGWINDGAMSVFFLLVGLAVNREFARGQLANWAHRRLPFIAAAAGMAVPALVYLLIAGRTAGLGNGWAIPAATDIAFALGVLALLGKRVPASLKLFVTTVAIVDDIGAIVIIALFYAHSVHPEALALAAATFAAMVVMNRAGIGQVLPYVMGFVLLRYFTLSSGVHPTVAGVLAAMTVPLDIRSPKPSTLHRIEHAPQRPVAFVVVPLFGFANAGVEIGGALPWATLPVAVALGRFIGKQAGVFGGVWLAVRLGWRSGRRGRAGRRSMASRCSAASASR